MVQATVRRLQSRIRRREGETIPVPLGIFADIVAALAPAVGGSELLAGYLIGFLIVFSIFIATVVAMSSADAVETGSSAVIFIAGSFGIILAVIFGLWDSWTVVFIGIVLAWLLNNAFGSGGGA